MPKYSKKSKGSKGLSEKAQAKIHEVIKKFETGDLSDIVAVARMQMPEGAPAYNWTFSNRVLAFATTTHPDARGFNQWKEANRSVKKGSRAGYIFGPKTIKDGEGDEETVKVIGYFAIPVFGASDTDGENDIQEQYTPKEMPPLADVAAKLGIKVEYGPAAPSSNGHFTPSQNAIYLGTQQHRTWYHELAHAIHFQIDENASERSEAERETIAEFTACVLSSLYGDDTSGMSYSYIGNHYKDPVKGIMKTLKYVEQVIEFIEAA